MSLSNLLDRLRRREVPPVTAPAVDLDQFRGDRSTRATRAAARRANDDFLARNPTHPIIDHVVDDRAFLLALCELYRGAIKPHERGELLRCARVVASAVNAAPANVPIEGYYGEDAELTEYFRLMRALQDEDGAARQRVESMPEFRRLHAVTSSPIYGSASGDGRLLPPSRDALYVALADRYPEWSLHPLIERARDVALATDDFSLVGLAVVSRDPVVVAALRESVVLYVERFLTAAERSPIPQYLWRVDPEIARRAAKFIATFNELFGEDLPAAIPDNAEEFFRATKDANIVGRCVAIGSTPGPAPRHYHWAIVSHDGELSVEEFWDDELWTTTRFRRHSVMRDLSPSLRRILARE